MKVRGAFSLFVALIVAACGNADEAGPSAGSPVAQDPTTSISTVTTARTSELPTTTAAPTTTDAPTTTTAELTTTTTTATPTSTTTAPERDCVLVEDFGDGADQRWRVVNDGVMGGLSEGFVEFDGDTMVFSGLINTNGGGFSSVRFALPDGWGSATELLVRARTGGRAYEIQVDDALDGRNRRITHFGPIRFEGGDGWQEARVDLTNLQARVFGSVVDAAPFRPDLATSVGVILADGADGPFRFEIDRLEACR